MFRHTKSACLLLVSCLACSAIAAEPDANNTQASREAEFAESLTGATLVGNFTVTGQERLDPKADRYDLTSVKQLEDGNWLFVARIVYGDHDVAISIALPVKWAGDTPVITVDKVGFPGLGTYTARVMIYEDHYAGFWQGAERGGHLFGVVERGDAKSQAAD